LLAVAMARRKKILKILKKVNLLNGGAPSRYKSRPTKPLSLIQLGNNVNNNNIIIEVYFKKIYKVNNNNSTPLLILRSSWLAIHY
jgi:hypothetical protein